ncbi:hypothetical protein [Viridibacillus arvi]|uniref:hypothetical protein n=1 Tax=Viridibacillus arvi TaxID=263475 RepID=UPI0034CFC60A
MLETLKIKQLSQITHDGYFIRAADEIEYDDLLNTGGLTNDLARNDMDIFFYHSEESEQTYYNGLQKCPELLGMDYYNGIFISSNGELLGEIIRESGEIDNFQIL